MGNLAGVIVKKTSAIFALSRIQTEWKNLTPESQPWGVWVRQYMPIPNGFDGGGECPSPFVRAWFINQTGISPRNYWEYRRMSAVQFEKLWCKKTDNWERTIWSTRGRHEIGLAGFAEYENSNDIYLETIWGGLFGRGMRITLSDGVEVASKNLWLS
jgi:hypothetical protein